MNKEDIKGTIARTLEAINEEYRHISSRQDIIPHIEMDLIMENTRKLYENLLMLNKVNEEKIKPYHSIETNNAKPAAREEITKEIKKKKQFFPSKKKKPLSHQYSKHLNHQYSKHLSPANSSMRKKNLSCRKTRVLKKKKRLAFLKRKALQI